MPVKQPNEVTRPAEAAAVRIRDAGHENIAGRLVIVISHPGSWLDHIDALTVAARMRTHDCQPVSVISEH